MLAANSKLTDAKAAQTAFWLKTNERKQPQKQMNSGALFGPINLYSGGDVDRHLETTKKSVGRSTSAASALFASAGMHISASLNLANTVSTRAGSYAHQGKLFSLSAAISTNFSGN